VCLFSTQPTIKVFPQMCLELGPLTFYPSEGVSFVIEFDEI
jgi:hypothetical protein